MKHWQEHVLAQLHQGAIAPHASLAIIALIVGIALNSSKLSAGDYTTTLGSDLAGIEASASSLDVGFVEAIPDIAPSRLGSANLLPTSPRISEILQIGNGNLAIQGVGARSLRSRAFTSQVGNDNAASSLILGSPDSFVGQVQIGNRNKSQVNVLNSPSTSVLNVQLGDNLSNRLIFAAPPGTKLVILNRGQ